MAFAYAGSIPAATARPVLCPDYGPKTKSIHELAGHNYCGGGGPRPGLISPGHVVRFYAPQLREVMPNHMKFCGCSMCSRHTPFRRKIVRSIIRKFRRKAKEDLRNGKEPDNKIGVPYTD